MVRSMAHFLFSADALSPRRVDECFEPQRAALEPLGHTWSTVTDGVLEGREALRSIAPGSRVVYRGWMITEAQHRNLEAAIVTAGGRPWTSTQQYLAAHHLPNWYPLLASWTPLTKVLSERDDLEAALTTLGWREFFIKDYVKSLKTSVGSRISDPSLVGRVVAEMRAFRGHIEGGICVRQVEPLLPDSERRYFVIAGRAFAPDATESIPPPVLFAAGCIESPFFSVDVARREDSTLRIVEIGDGQVSDLVGWTPSRFAALW
jgi:hypothetical protein